MAIVKSSFCPPLTALASRQHRGKRTHFSERDEAEPTLKRPAIDTSVDAKPDTAEEPSTPTQLVIPTTQGSVTTTFTELAAVERIEKGAAGGQSGKVAKYASLSIAERQEASTITQRFDELDTISTASPLAGSRKTPPPKPPLVSEQTPTLLRQEPIVPPPRVDHEASSLADTQRETFSSDEENEDEQKESISNGSGETAIVDLGAIPWVTPLPKLDPESAQARGIQTPLVMVSSSEPPPPTATASPRRPLNPIPFHHYSTVITTRTKKKQSRLRKAALVVTAVVTVALVGLVAVRPHLVSASRAQAATDTAHAVEPIAETHAPPPPVAETHAPPPPVAPAPPPETAANAEEPAPKAAESAPPAETVAAASTAATAAANAEATSAETASPTTNGAKTRAERRPKPSARPRGRVPVPARRAN